MTQRIVWGVLSSPSGLLLALGRVPPGEPVTLADHALWLDPLTSVQVLVPAAGGCAPGLRLADLGPEDMAILDFAATALGAGALATQSGQTFHHGVPAGHHAGEEPAGLALALLRAILERRGQVPAAVLAARRGSLAVTAASALRAAASAPVALRHAARPADLDIRARRHPYNGFFAVEETDLAWRRFDGTHSPVVTRAVFAIGDAVTVLPYDPVRDRVLLIEQFRAGPLARGDAQPWSLEAIAGRIDPGETPEQAARREAVEEAGLTLADLQFVARYYPSPGAVAEYLFSYLALTDLPDSAAGIFGLDHEAEDIRGHLVDFTALMDLVSSGEIENAPLLLSVLWLQRERSRLRQEWPAQT